MVTALVAFSTPYRTAPYLSSAEYKAAPTGVDVSNLAPGGQAGTEDAVLAEVINDASGWVDDICDQILAATVDIEGRRLRVDRAGRLKIHPKNWPVLEVRDLQFGTSPSSMQPLADLSSVWIEEQAIIVEMASLGLTSSAGPLQFGTVPPGREVYVRWTYVNGWPNTLLGADAAAAATSITVADTTGIYPADATSGRLATRLTVDTGSIMEQVTVTGTPTGGVVPVTALTYAHSKGVRVHTLPSPVKRATVLLTSALIKTRGEEALIMPQLGGGLPSLEQINAVPGAGKDVQDAKELLLRWRRVR